jgi:hypothetical protein
MASDLSPELGQDLFPNVGEDLLQYLTAWPTGEEAFGRFYGDLFGPISAHPTQPSPTSTDPLLLLLSDLRSTLANVAALRHSGAFLAMGHSLSVIDRSMLRFIDLYEKYNVCLIQNCGRAVKFGATESQRERFRRLRWWHPTRARSPDEVNQR